jgi:SHS2 domain-containing protein
VYRWIDHTGELELAIEAATEDGVFVDALQALGELLGEEPGGARTTHEIRASARDRGALLAEWLSELLFLAETEAFVPERVVGLAVSADGVVATVEGRQGNPPHLVKAVTYHRLEFRRDDRLWRARVVLDV